MYISYYFINYRIQQRRKKREVQFLYIGMVFIDITMNEIKIRGFDGRIRLAARGCKMRRRRDGRLIFPQKARA